MELIFAQALSGLASASSLFLVAAGLSLIFGVTRIVNFAHGALAMLGAYLAWTLSERMAGAWGFWAAMFIAPAAVAALGAALEITLLRRIYAAPELFQLLATFGVTLIVEDAVLLIWGAEDLLGRRAPGFSGAVTLFGQRVPAYDLFLIAAGPLVLAALLLLLRRTRWGVLVRAATEDRMMVAALGHDEKRLFTAVFALGAFLAGFGGALQIPHDAVSHLMDLRIVVDVFVVVVIGGLGSIGGAFLAALLVSELNAFGILFLPKVSLVLIFAVMAAVLTVRPRGLLGRALPEARPVAPADAHPWRRLTAGQSAAALATAAACFALPALAGPYGLAVASEIAIFALFASALHLVMSVGGVASFGHAAFFGLGAYGAALTTKAGASLPLALVSGVAAAAAGAALCGALVARLSGVYAAMLTLAFAQILWSAAFQWTGATGGDNGVLGVWPPAWASAPAAFYWLTLTVALCGLAAHRRIVFGRFGYRLRAVRDSRRRAEAVGVSATQTQWTAFLLSGAMAGAAGGLFAFLKGGVFPDALGIPLSVDALVIVLLGGVGTVSGVILGAVGYKGLSIWLVSVTDHSKLGLGLAIVALVLVAPGGVGGLTQRFFRRRAA